jgi:ubiquinone/menaquinone biosynthesis C-methylase UbiE
MRTLIKRLAELSYWTMRRLREGALDNAHYEFFFTEHFGLDRSFYSGKRILDVGCGPRGSLEWADDVAERVGLDPLASTYRRLGSAGHDMRYVTGGAEEIPFPDGYFDVVSSFNSLDHVDSLDDAVREIVRVLAAGGTLLLVTDVNHRPTVAEPQTFGWNIVEAFAPLRAVQLRRFEKAPSGTYETLVRAVPYDDADATPRYGVLSALLIK